MIYVTGDCHADFHRFSKNVFPEQDEMTRDDFVIVCGDFGGVWHDSPSERYWLDWLSEKPFTLLFVDGNHENFDRLYSDEFPIVDFHGGKAHMIRDNVFHLMRGYVFELGGKRFFAFGGASSHDISDGILDESKYDNSRDFLEAVRRMKQRGALFRINHISWWELELPTSDEMTRGFRELCTNGYKVDYIISHCAPSRVASLCGFAESDVLTKYFDDVSESVEFGDWFFGHYHDNRTVLGNYHMLYEQIVRIL